MIIKTLSIHFNTHGNTDIIDITKQVQACIQENNVKEGNVIIFSPSSTSGLTTIEYETGCLSDLRGLLDKLASPDQHYEHNAAWGDGNGHAHLRAALIKASLTVPFVDGKLTLGTWQQIVYLDFDNRPRQRKLVVQLTGV